MMDPFDVAFDHLGTTMSTQPPAAVQAALDAANANDTKAFLACFPADGVVDEETQKNDLDIVREVLKVTKEFPIERAYDFSFAKKADSELTQAGWKP